MGVQRSVTGFKYGTYGHIAVKDFDTALLNLQMGQLNYAATLLQQATEKVLKHVVTQRTLDMDKERLLKSHRLIPLTNAVGLQLSPRLRRAAKDLSDYHFELRYPNSEYADDAVALEDFDDYIELYQECITLARSLESSAIDKTIANSAKVGRMKLD